MKLAVGSMLLVLLAFAAGCGSGDSSTVAERTGRASWYPWLKGPTREFLVAPGGDNVVQMFGEEGTTKERAEATAVVTAWLRAREAKDWRRDCSYLSRAYIKLIAEDAHSVTDGKVKETCPAALAFFKGQASGDFVNTLSGSIDSLRVGEGEGVGKNRLKTAYAQYHGNDGKDWVVPLEWEDGGWKVSNATPINRLR